MRSYPVLPEQDSILIVSTIHLYVVKLLFLYKMLSELAYRVYFHVTVFLNYWFSVDVFLNFIFKQSCCLFADYNIFMC